MDNIRRTALIAALQQHGIDAKVAEGVQIVNDPEPEQTNLTPEKSRRLLEMFSGQIRKYATQSLDLFRPTPRIVTAQRPFYERYQYKPHNGKAEMARRRKQMDRTKPWGNPYPGAIWTGWDGARYTTDSHGAVCRFYS